MAAARSKHTYLSARYRRLSTRTGRVKAIVAIEHTLLIVIWNMTQTGAPYDDPGPDYYTRRRPDRTKNRAIGQLEAMGYTVTCELCRPDRIRIGSRRPRHTVAGPAETTHGGGGANWRGPELPDGDGPHSAQAPR